MKILSLTAGLLLLFLITAGSAWAAVTSSILSIQEVECYIESEKCSESLTKELESQLLTKSFFITDFSKEVAIPNIQVASFSKQVPGTLLLHVATKQTSQTSNTIYSGENAVDFLKEALEQENINAESIDLYEDKNILTVQINNIRAILTLTNVENDSKKLITILTNLDLETVDLAIVEIDVRYKLPVLRTSLSEL